VAAALETGVMVDTQVAMELAFPQADMTFVAFAESGDELVNTQKKMEGLIIICSTIV